MQRIAPLAACLVLFAVPAPAEPSWAAFRDAASGRILAQTCPYQDEIGHVRCFSLECHPGGPLYYTVSLFGGGYWEGELPLSIAVGAEVFGPLNLRTQADRTPEEHMILHDPVRHTRLLTALQSGLMGYFLIDPAGRKQGDPMPLSGAIEAIGAVLPSCSGDVAGAAMRPAPPPQ